jgi:VanZ family protein
VAEPGRVGRALGRAGPAIGWAALIFVASAQSRLPVGLPPFPHADKLFHAVAYAVLAALLARWRLSAGDRGRRALGIAVLLASLYGASDEWHQSFVPGRDPDPRDWAADTAGAVLGAALAIGLPRRRSRASIRS